MNSSAKSPRAKGAEDWEKMYPYHLRSQHEGRGAENSRFWFADSVHRSRAIHPFDSIGAEAVHQTFGVHSTRSIALPASQGLDVRMVIGFVSICPLPVTDSDEIGRRAEVFGPRDGHNFQNWPSLHTPWQERMLASIEAMKGLKFDAFPRIRTTGSGHRRLGQLGRRVDGRQLSSAGMVWQKVYDLSPITVKIGVFNRSLSFR